MILAAKNEVRNRTVPRRAHPTARYQQPDEGITRLEAEDAIAVFKTDSSALSTLVRSLRHVARRLLIERLFGLGILDPLQTSASITAKPGKKG